MKQSKIQIENMNDQEASLLIGQGDCFLRQLSDLFNVEIVYRSNEFIVLNDHQHVVKEIEQTILILLKMIKKHVVINESDVIYASRQVKKKQFVSQDELISNVIGKTMSGKEVYPKTQGQYMFIKAMEKKSIVFAIGPAGTGKTYLAVIKAVSMLKRGEIKRIVLTRPAVEAGESLGFLPGDLKEKVDPYLRPLYDALHEMLGVETTERYIEKGTIEIAPLAYMRGRTLNEAFIILDEAQNTTSSQMKMFLTRLGNGAKMVITGDITQIDLAKGKATGLSDATQILDGISEIAVLRLSSDDVVRHPLVQKIIEQYAKKGV